MSPVVPSTGSEDRGTDHAHRPACRLACPTRVLLGLVLAGALLTGCGGDDGGATAAPRDPPGGSPGSPSVEAVTGGVCEALAAAEAGDLATARETFDHGPLHELADAAIEIDRTVAARLLEAKQAVESDIADDGAGAQRVAEDLRSLAVATRDALEVNGAPIPALCEPEGP